MNRRVRLIGDGWFPDNTGGLTRYLRSLHESLIAAGIDATAVVVGPAADAPDTVRAPVAGSAPLIRRMIEMARAGSRDTEILDAHFALYGLLPALSQRWRNASLVVHFQGPWAGESAAAGTSGRVAVWAKGRVERAVYRRADELVTLSGAFRTLLCERYGVIPWQVSVIPPGVDLERFSPGDAAEARRRLGLPADAWLSVSVRRLVPRMGLDVLLEAWAQARPADGLLVVGGEGPEAASLARKVEELELGDSVRILGRVDEADLADLYRAADLTIVPSRELEGFGLVALESLACGTPVVVTDVGGLPDSVRALDPSLIVRGSSATALAERISRARDGVLPDRLRCRAHAVSFDWARVAEKHIELYNRAGKATKEGRPRVVYLGHSAELSGAELALLRLLPALSAEVEPHVILAQRGPLVQSLQRAGISVEVLGMSEASRGVGRRSLGLRSAPGAVGYTLRLARRLRRLEPDLVHTNSLKAGLYGTTAARLARVPSVWHVHDRIADDYLSPRVAKLVRVAVRRLPTAVIANSATTLETLLGARNTTVVGNAIAAGRARAASGRDSRALRVGMVGRIAPWKGQHVFVRAFARAFPSGSEEAVIVGAPLFGRGEHDYFESVRALGDSLGLRDRLSFTGHREHVADELAGVDVLVHASVLPEPFGQVIVEGMAANLPVVAAAAGGALELIEDGVDGLLYAPGDEDALARVLLRLAGDPELRARLGDAGRAKAARFAPEVIAAEVAAVYRDVLAARQVVSPDGRRSRDERLA